MNRLVSANYAGNYTLEQYPAQVENYKEGPVTYDKNGNIMALERYGLKANNTTGAIDVLTYSYLPYSNQLKGVNDTADSKGFNNGTTGTNDDYSYDANGNLKKDLNRGYGSTTSWETLYNHLNLPKQVKWAGSKQVNYMYDANGVKLEKKVSTGPGSTLSVTQYDGAFVYSDSGLFFSHPEGYVNTSIATVGGQAPQFAQMEYIYQYKDHLGNVRLSYKKGLGRNSLDVIEEENYYAFGMKHEGYNNLVTGLGNATAQKYEYNGKEYQDEMGLNWNDYGWRNYDATIGRWMNVDPLAERHFNNSPYMYCNNNPVVFLDPDGRDMITFTGTDAAALVKTIQGALETGGAWSIEFEWATGSLYAEKDVYDAFEGSRFGGPGGNISLLGADEGEILKSVATKMGKNGISDLVFNILAHGNTTQITDHKGNTWDNAIENADEFDHAMIAISKEYANGVKNNEAMKIFLFSCWSGTDPTGKLSMAKQISLKHNNSIIFAFDGRGHWESTNGNPKFMGIGNHSNPHINNNKGSLVIFKNGIEINRIASSPLLINIINNYLNLKSNTMKLCIIILLLSTLVSCKKYSNQHQAKPALAGEQYFKLFDNKDTLSKLERKVILEGDTIAFLKMKDIYYITEHQYDFLYYATVMANEYDYHAAHSTLYGILRSDLYKESKTNKLANYHLLRSYETGNKSAVITLKNLFPQKIPKSSDYWDEIN